MGGRRIRLGCRAEQEREIKSDGGSDDAKPGLHPAKLTDVCYKQ